MARPKITAYTLVYDDGSIKQIPFTDIRQLVKGFTFYWMHRFLKKNGNKEITVGTLYPTGDWPSCLEMFWDTYDGGRVSGQQMGKIMMEIANEFGYKSRKIEKWGRQSGATAYEIQDGSIYKSVLTEIQNLVKLL